MIDKYYLFSFKYGIIWVKNVISEYIFIRY